MAKERDLTPILRTVFAISQQRHSARRKLHADLMRSARMKTNTQQGDLSEGLLLVGLARLVVKDRFLDTVSCTIHHVGLVFDAVVIEQIGQRCRRCLGSTVNDCKVGLFERPGLNRRRKLCRKS